MDTVPDDPVADKQSRAADTVPDDPATEKPPRVTATIPDDSGPDKPALDKPTEAIQVVRDESVPTKPRKRVSFLRIFAVLLVLVGIVVGVGVSNYRQYIRDWIVRDALKRGFVLDFADFELQPDLVQLSRVHVTMVDVPGIEASFDTLKVHLQDLRPLKIEGQKSIVDVSGSPDELQRGLVTFAKTHQESVHLSLIFDGEYRYGSGGKPIVVFTGHVESPGNGELSLDGSFRIRDTNLGSLAMRRSKNNKVELGFGLTLSDKPVVSLAFDALEVPFRSTVTFASQKVDDVCRALAVPVPKGLEGSTVAGTISFVLDGALPDKPHHGTGAFVVTGWVPPHPRELDGIVFGKTTKLGATFEVTPDLGEVRFTKATVDAGALHLEGKGNVLREGLSARTKLDLVGNVPCSELGASAIGSHVRGFVGDLLRGMARATMGGTVKIRVTVEGDTNSPSEAKVQQAVDIGCRLR